MVAIAPAGAVRTRLAGCVRAHARTMATAPQSDHTDTARSRVYSGAPPKKVAVVGGGISGLAMAYYLRKVSPETHVTVLEKSARAGGFINTSKETVDVPSGQTQDAKGAHRAVNTVVEWGPRTLRTVGRGSTATMQLTHELGLDNDVVYGSSKALRTKYILKDGSLSKPFNGVNDKIFGALWPLIKEPFLKLRKETVEDETVHQFVMRRFGPRIASLVAAVGRGIYGGDTRRLSARSSSFTTSIWNHEWNWRSSLLGFVFHREVVRKVAAKSLLPTQGAQDLIDKSLMKGVYSFQGGLTQLTEALRGKLQREGVVFVPNADVRDVFLGEHADIVRDVSGGEGLATKEDTSSNEGTNGFADDDVVLRIRTNNNSETKIESFDHVVCAVPSYEAAELLSVYDVHDILASIPHANMTTVSLVIRSKAPKTAFGYLVPWTESNEKVFGCVFDSEALPDQDNPQGVINRFTYMVGSGDYAADSNSRYRGSESVVYNPSKGQLPKEGTPDDAIYKVVQDAAIRHLGIDLSNDDIPLEVRIVRHYGCIGQHELAHHNKMHQLRKQMVNGPLCNKVSLLHTSYTGVGVIQSVQNARELAEYLGTLGRNRNVQDVTGLEFTRSVYKRSTV